MPEEQLERLRARRRAEQLAQRARRVAGARRSESDQRSRAERRHGGAPEELDELEETTDETTTDESPDSTETPAGAEAAESQIDETDTETAETDTETAESATADTVSGPDTGEAEAPPEAAATEETNDKDPALEDADPTEDEKDEV